MRKLSAEEIDRMFDEGVDMMDYVDMSTLRKPNQEQKALSLNLPPWLVEVLDQEAARMGVSRQAVIKMWLCERADDLRRSA